MDTIQDLRKIYQRRSGNWKWLCYAVGSMNVLIGGAVLAVAIRAFYLLGAIDEPTSESAFSINDIAAFSSILLTCGIIHILAGLFVFFLPHSDKTKLLRQVIIMHDELSELKKLVPKVNDAKSSRAEP